MGQPALQSDLVDWLRLEQTAGVGSSTACVLLTTFGLPANIFASSLTALRRVVSEKIGLALLAPISDLTERRFECALAWAQQPNHRILTLADDDYPSSLLNIPDPPLLLYVMGRVELLKRPSLAVVGSRNATVQGNANADRFSEMLSQRGLTIISGLALGIDSAAHRGALRCLANNTDCGGSTVAVIGTGADIVYPARNRDLAHQIAELGCIVSEYPLGMSGIAANFPRRNRIISGLSSGVLVIEAAAQSGSLITARMAAEQGRDVFAIPGSIHSPLSKGCHQLIKQGAKLVESAQDILEEMLPVHAPIRSTRVTSHVTECLSQSAMTYDEDGIKNDESADDAIKNPKDQLLTALGFDPASLDALAARSGMDIAALNAQLLTLELEGLVEMLPGGVYRRLG
ncbi:DNA-processing protein DprA [Glaciimonas sp. PCH181]|uniref:DNA-processing protein DprA n=1 Tax=Glaciimonas sp. PCH181 TaxID=2133943 RepID=UPI00191C3917|nr:DNA-processing protein DprA [Glaciimonas sp. PCH181]